MTLVHFRTAARQLLVLLSFSSAVFAADTSLADLVGADIGATGPTGSEAAGSSRLTVTSGGTGLDGWNDSLRFTALAEGGDLTVVTRVISMSGNKNARAGLDIRDGGAADAAHVGVVMSPQGTVELVSRINDRLTTVASVVKTVAAPPLWLRLSRAGDVFTAATSRDGSQWVEVGSLERSLPAVVDVGLATSSGSTSWTAETVYADYAARSATAPSPNPAPNPEPNPQPEPPPPPAPGPGTPPLPGAGEAYYGLSYAQRARAWDLAALNARLGPSFADLNPGAPDTRPLLFKPTSKTRSSGYVRTNPYELGTNPQTDGDYWSDSGQLGYLPDDPANNAGIDRIQTFAYYDRVFAISPRLDWASGKPRSDPQTRDGGYIAMNGGQTPVQPIAMVRNYAMRQNEALVIYRDGLFAVAGTQTSRGGGERPYPGFRFPAHKVPSALAVTSGNEFALVTIWDTQANKGQLAIVAMEGKFIPFHSWPYMGLPNQGSWSDLKLLGYVDLPMATPTSISAATNGYWKSPSQTNGRVLSQIDLASDTYRKLIYESGWTTVVPTGGYAIVASKEENKVAVLDLAPLISYFRESWLSSNASFKASRANRGYGDTQFPNTFAARPGIVPTVAWQGVVNRPTAVLAGIETDRWTRDYIKGYVASEDGYIHIINTSSLMVRSSWQRRGALAETGSFFVGRNPVALCFTRHRLPGESFPLLPIKSDGTQTASDPLNNTLWVACRGEREVRSVVTQDGNGAVVHRIADQRMADPVSVNVAERGNILMVSDFLGRKMLSFRIGAIWDGRNKVLYGAGADGKADFELAGTLDVPGYPYLAASSNTN